MMEWYWALALILGSLVFMMATGMPVAFCFMLVNVVGVFLWWGGVSGLEQLILSIHTSVTSFNLIAVPLFMLMGVAMFYSGVAPKMIDALEKWLGKVPGRLSLLTVGAGTLFATLTGSTMSSTALLGTVLTPELEKRGYKKSMSLGPILGSGALAMMIPPSSAAVLVGAIGNISVGKILIAIVFPGLLMAVLYAAYIIIRCRLQPHLAPAYDVALPSLKEKLDASVKYILPLALIVFLVTGVILVGVATPTEAAATGALGTFILVMCYKKLTWDVIKKSFSSSMGTVGMVFFIITGAESFSQNLAFTGASKGLSEFILSLPFNSIGIMILMLVVVIFLGMFMNFVSIMMITLPIFVPVVQQVGIDVIWFAALYMIALETGATSPPFGLDLFVLQALAPAGTTIEDCYKAAMPYLYLDVVAMALIMAFPGIALWLPHMMK